MPNFAIGIVVKVLIEKRSYTSVSVFSQACPDKKKEYELKKQKPMDKQTN